MTKDFLLTQACARALGFPVMESTAAGHRDPTPVVMFRRNGRWEWYEPLYNDEQAMQLVKRFEPIIAKQLYGFDKAMWKVTIIGVASVENHDLNRALVECVAKLGGQ